MLHLEIVTPEKKIFSDTVEDVYLPAEEGEMGVLELHTALVTTLIAGELRYQKDGEVHELAIGNGFAEVSQEKVSVLTDMAADEAEIDEASVEAAMKQAEEAINTLKHDGNLEEITHLQATIGQSLAKLNLKRKRRKHI